MTMTMMMKMMMMMMMTTTNLRTTDIDVDRSADSRLKVEWCTDNQIIFTNVTPHNSPVKC